MEEKRRELPRTSEFYSLDGTHIQNEQAFTEIANAILRLRSAFMQAGFEPPKSIELASHEDGYRMRHILPSSMIMATPAANLRDENDTDVLFPICGVEVRYPAKFRKLARGRTETL